MSEIKTFFRVLSGTMLMGMVGCAAYGPNPAAQGSIPLVQNCGVIQAGTPSRFACNGKVYTSYQLAKLREDEAKKYLAGH